MTNLTRARFAWRLASMMAFIAPWCRDTINPDEDLLNEPERREPVERFIREMRKRLDWLEEELGRLPDPPVTERKPPPGFEREITQDDMDDCYQGGSRT